MKIFLAQQNYHIGNFEYNTGKILAAVREAKNLGGDLIVFSELCVCGYPPRDFLYFDDFIEKAERAVQEIARSADGIAVLIGAPQRNPRPEGKNLFNAAFFLEDRRVKQVVQKTCLPTYDVFDEDRYFEPAQDWQVIPFKGKKLAVTICEDIWNLGHDPLYRICPMDKLKTAAPDVIINLSASPFDYTHDTDRMTVIRSNVLKYGIPLFYCNATGSQTEIVFDGGSMAFDRSGNMIGKMADFKEEIRGFSFDQKGEPVPGQSANVSSEFLDPASLQPSLNIHKIHTALVEGIRDYFSKMGFQKAVVGSSGGIDSAVTLAIACEALGKENVRAVLMPSSFSSAHSVEDAVALSENLDNPYDIIPIQDVYSTLLDELKPIFKDLPFNVAEENAQSRTRCNILMTLANKFGYILLNTSNKSELATGYGTLYGDMAGGLSVLGDCYKTQVYELARFINRNGQVIPDNIIIKEPSAELRPGQKDTDSLPEYAVLDQVLYQYIERVKSPAHIKKMGFDPTLVDRILRMVNINEYKRNQFCPIIRISPKSFGPGRRMPIVGSYLL